MGGSIKLEKSEKDKITAFSFSMSVKYKPVNSAFINVENVENDEHMIVINQRFQNSFPELQQYLNMANVLTAVEFKFKNELEGLQEKVEQRNFLQSPIKKRSKVKKSCSFVIKKTNNHNNDALSQFQSACSNHSLHQKHTLKLEAAKNYPLSPGHLPQQYN